MSNVNSAVVKVPQRAVKKAMKNTKKLLGVGQGGSQRWVLGGGARGGERGASKALLGWAWGRGAARCGCWAWDRGQPEVGGILQGYGAFREAQGNGERC